MKRLRLCDRRVAVARRLELVALACKNQRQRITRVVVVLDDQNPLTHNIRPISLSALSPGTGRNGEASSRSLGSRIVNTHPMPSPGLCALSEPPWLLTRF